MPRQIAESYRSPSTTRPAPRRLPQSCSTKGRSRIGRSAVSFGGAGDAGCRQWHQSSDDELNRSRKCCRASWQGAAPRGDFGQALSRPARSAVAARNRDGHRHGWFFCGCRASRHAIGSDRATQSRDRSLPQPPRCRGATPDAWFVYRRRRYAGEYRAGHPQRARAVARFREGAQHRAAIIVPPLGVLQLAMFGRPKRGVAKRVASLHELVPGADRIAALRNLPDAIDKGARCRPWRLVQNRSATPALTSWIHTPVPPALTVGPSGPPTGLAKPDARDATASAVAVVLIAGFIASPGRMIEPT